jgi:hypothetical protein
MPRMFPQIQELKNELGRLYATGADVSPQVLSTYGIAAVSHIAVSIAQQPASAALRSAAASSSIPSSELNALKRKSVAKFRTLVASQRFLDLCCVLA